MNQTFVLKDCSLSILSTGSSANSLVQLRDLLKKVPDSSIYYHFWGTRLSTSFEHPEYPNDFARWAKFHLHDDTLAERFSIIDPTTYANLSHLKNALIDTVDERLDELHFILWEEGSSLFHFLYSTMIIFDLRLSMKHPSELKHILPSLTTSSIFYHFIDARSRTANNIDDFRQWLLCFGKQFQPLIHCIGCIDPYFFSLQDIKNQLIKITHDYFS